jgi:hypothetical protein
MEIPAGKTKWLFPAFVAFAASVLATLSNPAAAQAQQIADDSTINQAQSTDPAPRTWRISAFATGGLPPFYAQHDSIIHYHEELRFYSASVGFGLNLTSLRGSGFVRGRGEGVVEITPYWQVVHPQQFDTVYIAGTSESFSGGVPYYTIHGVSITPFAFRWSFMENDASRFVPWTQPGLGVLWTSQTFPQGTGQPGGSTSRFNFTPQVAFGQSIFVRKNQSLDLGVRAVHITNFGLTTYDPGVNIIVEFTAGYSWWKGEGRR